MLRRLAWVALVCPGAATACASGSTELPPGLELPDESSGEDGGTIGPINPTTSLTTVAGSESTARPDDTGDDSGDTAADSSDTGETLCGNGAIDGREKCDGDELGVDDCVSQGFDEGTLACTSDCAAFDTAQCVEYECNNDLIEGEEVCDGTDLAGADCASEGFDVGDLACSRDCTALDTSACVLFSCGNDNVEGAEICDGSDLDGETCSTQGLEGGTLSCAGDCMAFDLAACACEEEDIGSMEGVSVTSGSTAGEDDSLPVSCGSGGGSDRVIGFTASTAGDYVFDTEGSGYDTVIAVFDSCDADSEIGCNDDTVGVTSSLSVTLSAGQSVVVVVDGFLGDTGAWDLNVNAAPTDCFEEDIMTMIGSPATTGTTVGEDEDFSLSCGGATGSVEHVLRFEAPATATFTFDTVGSDYDTVLAAFETCAESSELACNDDTDDVQSEISLDLVDGQEIFVVVSGFLNETGAYTLNITQS
ncbi:MAG: hypothetical protein AAF721_14925 [Myxococcota bacterium]